MRLTRPNILFVFPDQLSARWLPCYGHEDVRAPNLQRFSEQGFTFTRAYTNVPLCTPYRACLFTGKHPHQTGVTENGMRMPSGTRTLAHALTEAGYDTHYIGKWHLSGKPHCNRWVPPEHRGGFANFIGWESHHVDHHKGLIWENNPEQAINLEGHETDGLSTIVRERLGAIQQTPFFMAVSYQAPHPPCTPLDRHGEIYDGIDLCPEPNADREAWFKSPQWNADYDVQTFRKRYFGETTHIDEVFGSVLETLEETGLAGNTIVIFTSDHGEMAGCHGLFGKGVMYDESIRVPLMVRIPGGPEGTRIEQPVSTIDLHATLLDLCGATPNHDVAGESFAGLLASEVEPNPDRSVFVEYRDLCIVRGQHKLIMDGKTREPTALYDTKADPFEMNNLVNDPNAEAVRTVLSEQLRAWRMNSASTI